jgi:glycosyltransferase involved in cell wall biosynthesis
MAPVAQCKTTSRQGSAFDNVDFVAWCAVEENASIAGSGTMLPLIHCTAVIPCLNEAATIGPLVEAVARQFSTSSPQNDSGPLVLPKVLVVDDGSNDRTTQVAEAAGALVLKHPRPQGKGAALRTGLSKALELGFAWAFTLDGDGQHAASDMGAFLAAAERTDASLLVGNRMAHSGRMPWVRRHVNRWMSQSLSRLAGQPLPDTQCGFRLLRLSAWAGLSIATQHFEIESEMLLQFLAAGFRVEFVPIQVIYKNEQSKIHPIRDAWRWIQWKQDWTRRQRRLRA